MEKFLCAVLFFTGVLLAACTRFAAPVYAAAPAAPAQVCAAGAGGAGYCYLALDDERNFVLHYVNGATRQDTPVASASGSPRPDGSRAARFFWGGHEVTGCQTADGRLAVLQA